MDQTFFRAVSHPLRVVIVGAALAVAWSAVCVVAGGDAPSEAASNSLAPLPSLDSEASLASITDPTPPIVAPVMAALAPVVAPIVRVAAPVVAPVATPATTLTAVIAPVGTIVAPVTAITTDVVALVPVQVAVDPFVSLASAVAAHSNLASVPGTSVSPTSDLMSSEASTYVGDASTSFTAPSTSTAETVLSQSPPAGGPFGAFLRGSADQAVLPAPAGSGSGQSGSAGGLNAASDAPLTTPTPVRLVSSGSAFGTEVLPSAPTFDPGSSPD